MPSRSSTPLLAQGQIIRNHSVLRRIGTGGMGEVYEAVHVQMKRRVAIKVLHPDWCRNPDLVKRFFNEGLATNLIRHPAMVAIYDHGQFPDGMPFIIMEYLEGESLRKHFGRLDFVALSRVAWQIATALSAAHKKRIIHRDLKPDNVMLMRDDSIAGGLRVKILDFGLAKLEVEHEKEGAQPVTTRDGVALGTPEYMAPEQWLGAARVDGKADVYSLGVVLYETLATVPPFSATSSDKLRSLHLYERPTPLTEHVADLPPELDALIESMLHKTQSERPTMDDVANSLAVWLEQQSTQGLSPSATSSPQAPADKAAPQTEPAALTALITPPASLRPPSVPVRRSMVMAAGAGFLFATLLTALALFIGYFLRA